MPNISDELLARFGREPLNLALEHVGRFPKKGGAAKDESVLRQRAFVLAAAGRQADLGEFVMCGWSTGYFRTPEGLAIIPIWGDLGPMRAFWPWVYYEDLAEAADTAAKDGDIKAILYHIDSPGGYVTGLAECAAAIEAAAALKPSAAYADDYATSAAYWIAAASGRVSAPATGIVCSIGSICMHEEISRMLDDAGVTVNVIRSAPRKAEANPFEPLSQAARAQLQTEIATCADEFITAIARLRKLSPLTIQTTQAACLTAAAAATAKFADGIETFDQACASLLARAQAKPATPNPARGKAAQPKPAQPRAKTQKRATSRSSTMDPTTLTPEDQIARYDEIAAIVAEAPADDNAKIGQFVQIVGIVNAPAEEAADPATDPAADPAAPPADPAAPAARTRGNPHAAAIAASKEGKANPAGALAAISAGMTFAQFKALAPSLSKGNGLAQRMGQQQSAQRLGGDTPNNHANAAAKVVHMPTPAESYARRRAAATGKRG